MKKKLDIKLILTLTFLGFIGIIALIPYEMTTLMNDDLLELAGIPLPVVLTVNTISQTIMLFVLVLIGERCMRRTGLGAPIIEAWLHKKEIPAFQKNWIWLAIGIAFIGSVLVLALDTFIFMPNIVIPEGAVAETVWWQGLLAMFYGGFTEELMVRFFGMTFIVWLLAIITKKYRESIPPLYFYLGIILAALIFGIGHLPATIQIFGELSTILLVRALLLNGLLGLWFGYLYWKKGLEYAFIAHMSADIFLHVLLEPMFS